MATPGQLVKAVADTLGIPEATVIEVDRNLAAAGLRTMKGRGRGAARVTARDATNNLTALMSIGFPGSLSVKASADLVEKYARTLPHRGTSGKTGEHGYFEKIDADILSALPEAHSFLEGFEALISAAGAGLLDEHQIGVAVKGPWPSAGIYIAGKRAGSSANVQYGVPNPWDRHQSRQVPPDDEEQWRREVDKYGNKTDFIQYREINQRTVVRIGKLIAA